MLKKIDRLITLWIGLIIFNALFPTLEDLANLSDMILVDFLLFMAQLLLEPSPETFIVWIVALVIYIKARFFR